MYWSSLIFFYKFPKLVNLYVSYLLHINYTINHIHPHTCWTRRNRCKIRSTLRKYKKGSTFKNSKMNFRNTKIYLLTSITYIICVCTCSCYHRVIYHHCRHRHSLLFPLTSIHPSVDYSILNQYYKKV